MVAWQKLIGVLFVVASLAACDEELLAPDQEESDLPNLCASRAEPAPDPTTVDVSRTPKPNFAAELLALEASGEFIAPDALYERVVAELAGLEALYGGPIPVRSCLSPPGLILGFSDSAYADAAAGTYDAWNELNENLRGTVVRFLAVKAALIQFDGRYNFNNVKDAYAALPGVTYAEADSLVGDGSDSCLEVRDDIHYYIVDTASGDCPAGCIHHVFDGFEVDASGNIRHLGTHRRGQSKPDWFNDLKACRAFLTAGI